jgi:hypothetical protein
MTFIDLVRTNLSTLWSALTSQRVGRLRPVAAIVPINYQRTRRQAAEGQGGDRRGPRRGSRAEVLTSPHSKERQSNVDFERRTYRIRTSNNEVQARPGRLTTTRWRFRNLREATVAFDAVV